MLDVYNVSVIVILLAVILLAVILLVVLISSVISIILLEHKCPRILPIIDAFEVSILIVSGWGLSVLILVIASSSVISIVFILSVSASVKPLPLLNIKLLFVNKQLQ